MLNSPFLSVTLFFREQNQQIDIRENLVLLNSWDLSCLGVKGSFIVIFNVKVSCILKPTVAL